MASGAMATDGGGTECTNRIDCAANSVISLLPVWPSGFSRNDEPEGSGVVLGDGTLIATADHVLGPATSVSVRTRNGELISAEIVLRDSLTDVALLKIPKPLVPIESANAVAVADKSCAIGNSFGLGVSVSCGVISAKNVSGLGFNQIEDFVQTDAAVNPGMSGGAMVDGNGKFIGLLSAIYTRQSDANIGVNFAVSVPLVNRIVDDFHADGEVQHRRPGVLIKPAKSGPATGRIGGEVVRLKQPSMESDAGLLVGDIILYAGGRRILRAGSYATAMALAKSGQPFYLVILRDNQEITLTLQPE